MTGRYEEAIAAYKRALTRNPNLLPAHLDLAVIYSELGREEEARAEAAEVLRINPKYSLEVCEAETALQRSSGIRAHSCRPAQSGAEVRRHACDAACSCVATVLARIANARNTNWCGSKSELSADNA